MLFPRAFPALVADELEYVLVLVLGVELEVASVAFALASFALTALRIVLLLLSLL